MESLRRMREPAALAAVIVLAARVLIALVTAVVYAVRDTSGGLPGVAVLISYRAGDATLVVVLTVLVAVCVLTDPTRHSRALTTAAVIVVSVSVLVALTFAVMTLGSQSDTFVLDALDLLANVAVPVLGLVTLIKLLQLQPARRLGGQPYELPSGEQVGSGQPAIPPAPAPQYQPTWQPDVAAGAAWSTAGDAAAGAPASGWGTPGQQGGWQYPPPTPQPPPLPPGTHPAGPAGPDPQPDQGQPPGSDQPPNWWGGSQS